MPAMAEAPQLPQPVVLPLDLPTDRLAVGAYDPWQQYADMPLDLEHRFIRQDEPRLLTGALALARNRRTVLVTIEPFPPTGRPTAVLEVVVSGASDAHLRELAQVVRMSQPQVVLVRWGHEMELSGLYP